MKHTAYLLQAALVSAWWVGLAASPWFFSVFQYAGIPPVAFWSFLAPDLLLIAGLSIVRAYRASRAIEFIIFGAFAYASLYCVQASILTSSGFLPTLLMLVGLGYNAFLCFPHALFRPSASTRVPVNAAKTLVQVLCIWGIALGVLPCGILDAFDTPLPQGKGWSWVGGIGLFAAFSALGLSSALVMVFKGGGTPLPLDHTTRLVVTGPYRFVRNPMAIAGIGQALSIALVFGSIPLVVYALLGALAWHVVVRPLEERDLLNRFGEPYRAYQGRVRCWIPHVSGYVP